MTLFLLKTLNGLLNLLNSEKSPWQISAGAAFGLLMGLTPKLSLHNLVLVLLVFLLRVNLSMFFISFGIVSLIAFVMDPIFDRLGYWALVEVGALRPFWIDVTTGALWPYFRFNNTVVVGSILLGLVLFLPVWLGGAALIKIYRETWREQIKSSKLVKTLKATPLYGLYQKYETMRAKLAVFE